MQISRLTIDVTKTLWDVTQVSIIRSVFFEYRTRGTKLCIPSLSSNYRMCVPRGLLNEQLAGLEFKMGKLEYLMWKPLAVSKN